MMIKMRIYKSTKHKFKMWERAQPRIYGARFIRRQRRLQKDFLAGRHSYLRISERKGLQNDKYEKLFKWLSRLKKATMAIKFRAMLSGNSIKFYQSKRPRYYRGKPHTIEGYDMQLDYEERQKLIDHDNIEAMRAMFNRIKTLEQTLDSLLQETNTGDEVFEITEARISTATITEAKEVLEDVSWNPWNDKPTNYPSIKSQKIGKDGAVSITVTMSTGGEA